MSACKWKIQYLAGQIHRTAYKAYETLLLTMLLHDRDLVDLMPCLQYYALRDEGKYALIDLYYPQVRIGIEIYEDYHKASVDSDLQRLREIERSLGGRIFPVWASSPDVCKELEEAKTGILTAVIRQREAGIFNPWEYLEPIDIGDLQRDNTKCLFVKIRGRIKVDDYYNRQTGSWRIKEKWRSRIDRAVVVHDGSIVSVFNGVRFIEEGKKVRFSGKQDLMSHLIGRQVQGWTWQQTVCYSNDVRNV